MDRKSACGDVIFAVFSRSVRSFLRRPKSMLRRRADYLVEPFTAFSLHRADAHHGGALSCRATNFRARAIGVRRRDARVARERAFARERALGRSLALGTVRRDARAVFHVAVAARRAR